MAGYKERLRSLDGTRCLMRDFLVYGFRTRSDSRLSSARTYDNERRRIEGLLGDVLVWQYGSGGKRYFLSADTACLPGDPLHAVYRLRTFRDNDIVLHFYLMDALRDGDAKAIKTLTDEVSLSANILFEEQTVRRKLQKYRALGLVTEKCDGGKSVFCLSGPLLRQQLPELVTPECVAYLREAAPLGCVADELMLRNGWENRHMRFKHHFLMHTLDDEVLLVLLTAMRAGQAVELERESQKDSERRYWETLVPVCVRVSEQTGRRYLMGYDVKESSLRSVRLDLVRSVVPKDMEDVPAVRAAVSKRLEHVWGVSVNDGTEARTIRVTLRVRPGETYVTERLAREGRGGTVTDLGDGRIVYEVETTDPIEMTRWLRTFTGRILEIDDGEGLLSKRYETDLRRMAEMYGIAEVDDGEAV